ncbi:MAG: prepilin-type N-terminal cleavage/methylation domain-containing protein [Patescibacteria group bacterium]|nr:prepilin-type N-terminal cleavage/methylation domain-containing protein [Patescibacteria group bacterium]
MLFLIKKSRNQIGFTLIELLVSIFIITLISGLFLADYHSTNKRSELRMTAQKVISDIRLTQNNSLGSAEFNGSASPGGWGAYFDTTAPDSYIIFADIDGNQSYTDVFEKSKQIDLPPGIKINSIYSDKAGEQNNLSITFLPPDPITYINGEDDDKVLIELIESAGNSTITIKVNFFGLISLAD